VYVSLTIAAAVVVVVLLISGIVWRLRRRDPRATPVSSDRRQRAIAKSGPDHRHLPKPRFEWTPSDQELAATTQPRQPSDPVKLGAWQVLGLLSSGGMGSIYLVRHDVTGEFGVAKVLRRDILEDPDNITRQDFLARFEREANLVGQLPPHPNLPRFLQAAFEPGMSLPWLVMDYIPAPNLFQIMRRRDYQPLEAHRVIRIMADIAAAIIHLQANEVEHRDIKPENVLYDERLDIAYVIDLGLALPREGTRITRDNMFFGTLYFAAPERLFTEHMHVNSDIWSIGAEGFFLAAGKRPFEGRSGEEIARRINEASPNYSLIQDARLAEVISWCLQVDPGHRPNPSQLYARLKKLL